MSAGENYRYPERLEVFFTGSAEYRHALRVNHTYLQIRVGEVTV
jgi:hypothetical protein